MSEGRVPGNRIDPGSKRRAPVIALQRLPNLEKGVLRHFLCPRHIPGHCEYQPDDLLLIKVEKLLECPIPLPFSKQLLDIGLHSTICTRDQAFRLQKKEILCPPNLRGAPRV